MKRHPSLQLMIDGKLHELGYPPRPSHKCYISTRLGLRFVSSITWDLHVFGFACLAWIDELDNSLALTMSILQGYLDHSSSPAAISLPTVKRTQPYGLHAAYNYQTIGVFALFLLVRTCSINAPAKWNLYLD